MCNILTPTITMPTQDEVLGLQAPYRTGAATRVCCTRNFDHLVSNTTNAKSSVCQGFCLVSSSTSRPWVAEARIGVVSQAAHRTCPSRNHSARNAKSSNPNTWQAKTAELASPFERCGNYPLTGVSSGRDSGEDRAPKQEGFLEATDLNSKLVV